MSLLDIFRVGRFKREAETARREVEGVRAKLGDAAVMTVVEAMEAAEKAKEEAAEFQRRSEVVKSELNRLHEEISSRKKHIVEMDDQILLQEFGLFTPKYNLATASEYKVRLDQVRKSQSEMVKGKTAYIVATSWSLNGSEAEGRSMMKDYSKLIIRAFNTECDDTIERIKIYNADASRDRIRKSFDTLNRLGAQMSIKIAPGFLASKLEELDLALEFQFKRQDEKEAQKQLREQAREEAKLQREIDAALETLVKEERHFRRAQKAMEAQLAKATSQAEIDMLSSELASISQNLSEIEIKRQDVDYRVKHASAGYVYVVSNIGAFGADIFKIGVTRRLEPLDRIDELGGASVPFDFDVHAMVFSEDAYGLESALHRHFSNSRINMINGRKEFFRASLDEIEGVLRQHFSKPVEMTKIAEASAYRQSLRIQESSARGGLPTTA